TEVGKLVMSYAAQSNLKKTSLELGGKSPSIVLSDAPDLERAARATAEGIFTNSGQMCDSSSRLIVEEQVADEVVARIAEAAKGWQPGDPFAADTRMGAIVDDVQMARVLEYVD